MENITEIKNSVNGLNSKLYKTEGLESPEQNTYNFRFKLQKV